MPANEIFPDVVDFFFTIVALDEPEVGATHHVTITEWAVADPDETWPVETLVPGRVLETHITDNPYGMVEAAREAQAFTLEERLDMYAAEEQAERAMHA